jgi:predicted aconitase
MRLAADEQAMLDGERGEAVRDAFACQDRRGA